MTHNESKISKWAWCMNFCKSKNLSPASNKNWELANREYEAQQQEVVMSDQKEIKFQDKTRGGYEYRIYTRDGKNCHCPIIGETFKGEGDWEITSWTSDGFLYPYKSENPYNLIPLEPAELEGLKVGEPVYTINRYGIVGRYFIKERIGDDFFSTTGMCMHIDGTHNDIGNGQKLFFRSEERALASIKKEVK